MNTQQAYYVGSRICANTQYLIDKGFIGEFYNQQIEYAKGMMVGKGNYVLVTSTQLEFLLKDKTFREICHQTNAVVNG